jgi:GAF domain-containing protein
MSSVNEINELLSAESNFITNASNFSAYIFNNYEQINWVGFYLVSGSDLLLGPFQGKPACIRIATGKGVCGTSAQTKTPIIVEDVHQFEGHIACDSASNSELVIPIIKNEKLYGVLDIDSPIKSRFTNTELDLFTKMLDLLIDNSDLESVYEYYNS